MNLKETPYQNLLFVEAGGRTPYGYLKQNGDLKVPFFGKRQIKRAKEILRILINQRVDLAKLDRRFYSIFSLYLLEEKELNNELLFEEIRRLS
jgi:hypothetical protein